MKSLKITLGALLISASSFAQVGIGTNTPVLGSILELKAADKALLLTRVATTAAVATPINGMMVYDISSNCIKGYQNGAWTGCLSACGAPAGGGAMTYKWETDLRFTQILNNGLTENSGGITTDGQVFLWGRNAFNELDAVGAKMSPILMSGMGKWGTSPVKLVIGNYNYYVLNAAGDIWAWGSRLGNELGTGFVGTSVTQQLTFPNAVSMNKPPGVTRFNDVVYNNSTVFLLGNNGQVYFYGTNPNPQIANPYSAIATQLSLPPGVTSVSKIWANIHNRNSLYILGNNGNIYISSTYKLISGNTAIATSAATPAGLPLTLVNFPAGEATKVVEIDGDGSTTYALLNDGSIYIWGTVASDAGAGSDPIANPPVFNAKFDNQVGVTAVTTSPGVRVFYAYEPKKIKLPTGETKFVSVSAGNTGFAKHFVCESGKVYTIGSNQGGGTMGEKNYQDYYETLAVQGLNIAKVVGDGGDTGNNRASSLVLDKSGKIWGFGDNTFCELGAGFKCPSFIHTALPLMNGNLDPTNPRPQTVN